MSTPHSPKEPDPLANLIKLVNLVAAFFYQLLTKSALFLGLGSLIIILLIYLIFTLFGV